jgi:SAM-dependent methyltransferase/tetratricopeptide (TPR) repeat protein
MSRRDRRAALARGKAAVGAKPVDISTLATEATNAYNQGRSVDAEVICKQILTRDPAHPVALNILGIRYQASGNHRVAVKMLAKAVDANALDAACHYNIGTSYQALGDCAAAARHFNKAIALGLSGKGVEPFLLQNAAIAACASQMTDRLGLPANNDHVFNAEKIAEIADNVFLRCALQSIIIRGVTLELFLTALRRVLLGRVVADGAESAKLSDSVVNLLCSLAQQCFLNEYVFAQAASETQHAQQCRDVLLQRLADGGKAPPHLVAAVAAYIPLHSLPAAKSLLAAEWPDCVIDLLRLQVSEPLEEAEDRAAIPILTTIANRTSLEVMRQYEESPYPRWSMNPLAALSRNSATEAAADAGGASKLREEILIAGCGTGEHPFDVAQKSPHARILAVDLSLVSLAYARRKTREEGLNNIKYAQADILNLPTINRRFDRIEAVGVLHHLADPEAGWRALLALLAPAGTMRIGLYSASARRSIVEARARVAEHRYPATAEGVRALRQTIIRERDQPRWKLLVQSVDFYSSSGCRDMFFNVMEHRLTIPQIQAFLKQNGLFFLGFELDRTVIEKFKSQYAQTGALTNLDDWHAFETVNPQTFLNMYVFSVRRDG